MTPRKPKHCKGCDHLKPVNRKGYCENCAMRRSLDSAHDMFVKSGPFFEKWRASMLAYLERTEP